MQSLEKIEKENKSSVTFRFAFNFLEKGFAELALLINSYLIQSKHSRSDEDYLMCYVNLALSHRYSGNEDECIKMIKILTGVQERNSK